MPDRIFYGPEDRGVFAEPHEVKDPAVAVRHVGEEYVPLGLVDPVDDADQNRNPYAVDDGGIAEIDDDLPVPFPQNVLTLLFNLFSAEVVDVSGSLENRNVICKLDVHLEMSHG